MRNKIFYSFYILLPLSFLFLANTAYAESPADYSYPNCPHSVDAFSCGSDYITATNPKVCKTSAEMTSAYNVCYAVVVNTQHENLRCDNVCCWASDPKAATCDSLHRSFTACGNPAASCGGCVGGYVDISGICTSVNPMEVLQIGSTWYGVEENLSNYSTYLSRPIGGGASLWTKLADPSNDIYYTAGKVGIGTASPVMLLHIHNTESAASVIKITNAITGSTGTDGLSIGLNATADAYITQTEADKIIKIGNLSGYVLVSGNGNVGIGTTSPDAKLHVSGNGGVLRIGGTDYSYIGYYPDGPTTRKAWTGFGDATDNNFTIKNEISDADIILTTTGAGNVGIGTTSPGSKLDVSGTVNATDFTCSNCINAGALAEDSVGSSEIATGAVGSSEIASGAVGSSEIATDAVGSSEIATDAVGSSEIASGAVTSLELGNDSVGSGELRNDAITLSGYYPLSTNQYTPLTLNLGSHDVCFLTTSGGTGICQVYPNSSSIWTMSAGYVQGGYSLTCGARCLDW